MPPLKTRGSSWAGSSTCEATLDEGVAKLEGVAQLEGVAKLEGVAELEGVAGLEGEDVEALSDWRK